MSALHDATANDEHKHDIEAMENVHTEVNANANSNANIGHYANQEAHDETLMEALRKHPWTCVWVVYAIYALVSGAFDNQTSGNVVGIPRFRQDFGYAFEGGYVLPAKWQSAYSGGPAAATVAGTFLSGFIADKIGRKYTILIAYIIIFAGIAVEIVANTTSNPNGVFFAGKFINGIAIGALISTAMTYIAELAPLALRGIFTAAAAVAFTVGPFIVSLIVNSYGDLPSSWAYKSSLVAQYGVTGIAALIWPFMPESPNWLISKGRDEQAIRAFRRLGETDEEATKKIALIKLTLEEARRETEGATYFECFRKSNLRRTVVAAAPLTLQAFSGIFFVAGYATYYYQLAGFDTQMSFRLAVIQQVVSILGNVTAWFLIERVGRRPLTFWGLVILTVNLFVAGGAAVNGTAQGNKVASAFIIIYCYLYNVTIGATAYVAMSEIATSRLRQKTAAISLFVQQLWGVMWSFVLPYIFNPNEANLQAKTSFIFGGMSILCCVYVWFYHPETKGRTFEELDELFRQGVPARKFSSYITEAETKGQQVKEEVAAGKLHL